MGSDHLKPDTGKNVARICLPYFPVIGSETGIATGLRFTNTPISTISDPFDSRPFQALEERCVARRPIQEATPLAPLKRYLRDMASFVVFGLKFSGNASRAQRMASYSSWTYTS